MYTESKNVETGVGEREGGREGKRRKQELERGKEEEIRIVIRIMFVCLFIRGSRFLIHQSMFNEDRVNEFKGDHKSDMHGGRINRLKAI